MKTYLVRSRLIALIALLFFVGCKKETITPENKPVTISPANPTVPSLGQNATSDVGLVQLSELYIQGVVVDKLQNPMQGVEVRSSQEVVLTDARGQFRLLKTNTITFLKFTKKGYFSSFVNVQKGCFDIMVLMNEPDATKTFTAAIGGTIGISGFYIQFEKNSIGDENGNLYLGKVNAAFLKISPENQNFSQMIPGRDLRAQNADGQPVQLFSYGMVAVELTAVDGRKLNILPGKKAQISMSIDNAMLADAPAEIPLWHFDENKGIWVEEGKAVKNANFYKGDVSHFSYWNFDAPSNETVVSGKLTDCDKTPLPFLTITVGQTTIQTDKYGVFECLIPAGRSDLKVIAINPFVKDETVITNLPPFAPYKINTIADIKLTCGKLFTADLTGCDDKPLVTDIWLVQNGKPIYKRTTYLGKVRLALPYNATTGLEMVVASPMNNLPVEVYPVTCPLVNLVNYCGVFKICKTPPANSSGTFMLLDSLNLPMDKENDMYKVLMLATAKYYENTDETVIEFKGDTVKYFAPPGATPWVAGKIHLKGKGKGVYSLKRQNLYYFGPTDNYFNLKGYEQQYPGFQQEFTSADGTIEILEWGYYGEKVKVKVDAILFRYFKDGMGGVYYTGNHYLNNYTFEATRLVDAE